MDVLDKSVEEFLRGSSICANTINKDGIFRFVNQNFCDKMGYSSKDELIGKSYKMLFDDPSSVDKLLYELFVERKQIVNVPLRFKKKDGKIIHMKLNSIVQEDPNNNELYSRCFLIDSTEEGNLHELVFKIVNLLNDGIIIFRVEDLNDPGKLRFEFINTTADRIAGGNITKFVGKTFYESFPDFLETGMPAKYLECYKNSVPMDLGEVEYGDENVNKQVFKIECIPLNSERIIVHYYSVTRRQQIKDSLLSVVSETQTDILNRKSVHVITKKILKEVVRLTESTMGFVDELHVDEEGNEYLDCIAVVTDSWNEESKKIMDGIDEGKSIKFTRCRADQTMYGIALQENKKGYPFICADVSTDPRRGGKVQYPSHHPRLRAFMALPLMFHGQCIGQLAVANNPNGYNMDIAREVEPLLVAFANIISSYSLALKEEKLQKAVAEEKEKKRIAEEIAKAKDAFLANMSHELKTLLNGIVGMSQLMMDTNLNHQQIDYANTIYQCSVQLLAIINDILDYSKMEAGRLKLNLEPFELRECLEEAYDIVALKAGQKNLQISYMIEQCVPAFVVGDKARVKQVILNLLENAIKFTDKGEIVTKLDVAKEPRNGTFSLLFSIRDTGIGIEKEKQEVIFDVFTQGHDVSTKKYAGTGLGLPICKHIVNLMGGKLWVESEFGKGSTFHFTVKVEEYDNAPTVTENKDATLTGKKVLIVDDNSTNRTILSSTVIKWGMLPVTCGSAEEAMVFICSDFKFDVGLLDIQMPDVSGITLAEQIKQKKPELPLVCLSSMGDTFDIKTGLFIANLTKPVKHSRLYNILLNVLKPTVKVKYDYRNMVQKVEDKGLRILLVDDVLHNQKVGLGLLNKLGYHMVDVASNGVDTLEYLKRGSYDVLFLDLIMEPIDGFQTAREITRLFPNKQDRPYIVAMTAQTTDTIKEKCYQHEMDGFIGKPVVLKELETMLAIIEKNVIKKNETIVV